MTQPMADGKKRKNAYGVGTTIGFPPLSISPVFLKYVGPNDYTHIVEHATLSLWDDVSMSTKRAGQPPACS